MPGWAIGAGAIGTLAVALWGAWWRSLAKGLEKDLTAKAAQAEDGYRQFREEQAAHETEKKRHRESVARLEGVIALVNAELREADDQLLRCVGVVRSPKGVTPAGGVVSGLPGPSTPSSGGDIDV